MQTSMTDSEFNLDPNCLSRCSTELFSEASWEQVDKQDTEVSRWTFLKPAFTAELSVVRSRWLILLFAFQVTRWYPDHLAAQCYGCESRFWLATRRHHCR